MDKTHPKIRIACSREGVLFLAFVLGLASAAIYTAKNSLILLACFLIFTLIATILLGRQNVKNIQLSRRINDEIFANKEAHITLLAKNTGKHTRYAIHLYEAFSDEHIIGPIFVPSLRFSETAQAAYDCIFPKRGSAHFKQIQVRSRFPLPFFEFRAIYDLEMRDSIYPERLPDRDLIKFSDNLETQHLDSRTKQPHLQELVNGRQTGRILWKLSARRGQFVEELQKSSRASLNDGIELIPKHDLSASDYEKQISQITDYCLCAIENGQTVALHVSDNVIQTTKRRELLELLATV